MDAIILRSPFNGETIQVSQDQCSPAMLHAMVQAGFVHLNPPKPKTKSKETTYGPSETVGR